MSPATKTPGTEVAKSASRATLPRSVISTPRSVEQALPLGADEAHREQHQVGFHLEVGALELLELAAGHLDLVSAQRR